MTTITCQRGHKGPAGTRCKVRLGKGAECRELIEEQADTSYCDDCGRGAFVDGYCSFCGALESPHGDDWGHSCGQWFKTFAEWQAHVYGRVNTPDENLVPLCQGTRNVFTDPLSRKGRRAQKSASAERKEYRRNWQRQRRAAGSRAGMPALSEQLA